MDPVAQQRGEIEQRVAARALVPVHHGARGEVVRVQDHVVQLEVVVQQRRRPVRHQVAFPARRRCRGASASVPSSFAARPRLRQPADAAREESFRAAQVVQSDRPGVHRMDRRDRFQQHLRQARADLRPVGQFGRHVLPDHQAGPVFDDLEALAHDGGVVAQDQAAGDERQRIRQARQDAELARHVVGAGRQFPHRRAAQHGWAGRRDGSDSSGSPSRRRTGAAADRSSRHAPARPDRRRPRPSRGARSRRRTAGRYRMTRFLLLLLGFSIQQGAKRATAADRGLCAVSVRSVFVALKRQAPRSPSQWDQIRRRMPYLISGTLKLIRSSP